MPDRIPKRPTPIVREWVRVLSHAAKVERVTVSAELMTRLAAVLSFVGPPEDAEAQKVFWAFKALFLNKKRIGRWDLALQQIPADRSRILRIAECCIEFGRVAGSETLNKAALTLDRVVAVMVQVKNPKVFIEHAKNTNFLVPASLFHPNTLKAAEKRLRGALGTLSRDQEEHNQTIRSRVRVVRASETEE